MARLAAKSTRFGLVEVKHELAGYVLYVGGAVKAVSSDLNYIMSEYDKY